MAGALEALGEELVAQVLRRLPLEDLRQARLACKLFDAASRRQDVGAAGTCMVLDPNAVRDCPRPDWARLPRVRRLELCGFFRDADFKALESFISPEHPAAADGAVAELLIDDSDVDTALLSHLLLSLPGLDALCVPVTLTDYTYVTSANTIATLAVVATVAPALTQLHLDGPFDVKVARVLSRGLPGLRSFGVGEFEGDDEDTGAALAALPPALTSLRLGWCTPGLFPNWPQLRELRSIKLSATVAHTAALAMPNLRLLVAELVGDWADAQPAPFAHVTKASLNLSQCINLCVARLLPALRHLHCFHGSSRGPGAYTLGSLPGLTCLECANPSDRMLQKPGRWEDVAAAHGLRTLACASALADLPRLLAPLTRLHSLTLHVDENGGAGPSELGAILGAAVTRLSSLQSLQLEAPGVRMGPADLMRFARALPQLRVLRICEPKLQPSDVALLTAHPGLRTLSFQPCAVTAASSGQAEAALRELEQALGEMGGLALDGEADREDFFNFGWLEVRLSAV